MNNKNLNIQALRGICAIIVFFSHSLHVYNNEIIDYIDKTPLYILYAGKVAVYIFFVLSGFFYYTENKKVVAYKNTITKKIKRIYPAHIIFLTLGFVIVNLYQKNNLYNDYNTTEWFQSFWKTPVPITEYFKGCSILFAPNTNLINPPVWYLEAEVKMFIIMPLLIPFLNKKGWWMSFPILFICTIKNIPLIPYVGFYLLGSLARKYSEVLYSKINSSKFSLSISLFIAIGLLNIENEIHLRNSYTAMLSCIGASILIIILYNRKIIFLQNKVFQFLGHISYELYLCHFIVLLALKPFINNIALIAVSLLISILLAYISNRIITNFSYYGNKRNNE